MTRHDRCCIRSTSRRRRAFTLIEMLVVVSILGIAGAMVIPQMGSVGVLRVQGAIRQIVSDITFAQSDAIAFQQRRAIVFDVPNSRYTLVSIPGATVDPAVNTMFDPARPDGRYVVTIGGTATGGARIASATFNGTSTLIFDDMGSPAAAASGDTPGLGGTIRVTSDDQVYDIVIEPYTGRISVRKIEGN
ncbi:MAG: type II secretion system protein [Phycisphaerae bacterium]|nr:type II secretion system protein [Phycisphaerae bacterium]